LADGLYEFRQKGTDYKKVYIYVEEDTLKILTHKMPFTPVIPLPGDDQFFLKRSFDVDVMTVPFKYRPGTAGLPRQLNTDFNGNAYIGYRFDRFRVRMKHTPVGIRKHYDHKGVTLGVFGGLGSAAVNPSTTANQTTDDYNALILSRGVAAMIGVNNLTVGVGVGWDYVTDRDKDIWIYQNTSWFGLTVGLNLN
jgi:hypothetical protein